MNTTKKELSKGCIVPDNKSKPNPNPKWITIKGWAGINDEYGWKFIEQGHGVLNIPAELRVKAKYIKEKK